MNHDSFKQIELLFHELSELEPGVREARLTVLARTDPSKAASLRMMFDSLTKQPGFLDPSTIDSFAPTSVDIPLDGSVVLGGRYTLVERIGVGGSSTVFRAHASDPSRDVAIKMLRIGFDSQKIRDRFTLESQALASLTHPHIAHVYQTGIYVSNGVQVPWIAMELVSGSQTIIDYANTNTLDQDARIDLFLKVCEAVGAAHDSGVLHLDLNASNILIDSHGYPKIIDFGLFGILTSSIRKQPIHVGTRISMAPEQTVYQSGSFDERTDVYALGLLLTELVTGKQLQCFQGTSTDDALKLIAIGKARELLGELPDLPGPLVALIDTMIRINPDERFQGTAPLIKSILQIHGSTNAKQSNRRSPAILVGSILAVLLVAVVFVVRPQNTMNANAPELSAGITDPGMITIPRELAIDLTSQNPRTTPYSTTQTELLEGLELVIESDPAQLPEEQANLYARLADQHRIAGHYDEAVEYYQRSADIFNESMNLFEYNWVMLSLIQTQLFLERIDHAQHSLERVNRSIDLSTLFRVDLSLAETKVHAAMNRWENAFQQAEYTEELIGELVTIEDPESRIERLLNLASIYEMLARYTSAASVLRNAKSIAEQLDEPPLVEVALIDLRIGINEAPQATDESLMLSIQRMERSIIELIESGDRFHAAWGLRQLGNVHLRTAHFDDASDAYSKSRSLMIQILGDDHHESIICRAYELIVMHAQDGSDERVHTEFIDTMKRLSHTLGENHSIIRSLQSDWDNLYLWDTSHP